LQSFKTVCKATVYVNSTTNNKTKLNFHKPPLSKEFLLTKFITIRASIRIMRVMPHGLKMCISQQRCGVGGRKKEGKRRERIRNDKLKIIIP
jgi:hypothetical protein